jgi:hypothetical protein
MSIEVMKRALKTFEKIHEGCGFVKEDDLHKDAKNLATYVQEDCEFTMKTLRQAIEQAEKQEPVAYKYTDKTNPFVFYFTELKGKDVTQNLDVIETALYTAPPKREWVGLTDGEMSELYNKNYDLYDTDMTFMDFFMVQREVETKLKEKNT